MQRYSKTATKGQDIHMPQQDFFRYCTSHSINHCSDFGLHSMRCISTVKCSVLISNLILSNWIQRRSLSYLLPFEIFILEVIWSFLPRKSVSKVFYSRMYWLYTRSVTLSRIKWSKCKEKQQTRDILHVLQFFRLLVQMDGFIYADFFGRFTSVLHEILLFTLHE